MSVICPTVTAYDLEEYKLQLERIVTFAKRIHIDLMDGIFAPTKSPAIGSLWFDRRVKTDVHIMFQHPDKQVRTILELGPSLIVVQAEADKESVRKTIRGLKKTKVRVGLSLLAATAVDEPFARECIPLVDHVLIFSGHLGFHGGEADLSLLDKVARIKELNPTAEIGWDGGINDFNAKLLVQGGIDVLNTGGYIQKSSDPTHAYHKINDSLE